VVLKIKFGPASIRWRAEHTEYDPPHCFADVQRSGPFARWEHHHRFVEQAEAGNHCVLRDEIKYELPLGAAGSVLGGRRVRGDLEAMFAYRHRVTRDDLLLKSSHSPEPLTVAVSGSSGLVGQRLCSLLTLLGHRVITLERSSERARGFREALAPWAQASDAEQLSGVDAVVHLAGKPIAGGRWTDRVKREIRDSRIQMTGQLAAILAGLPEPPKVLVCASATGIYGDRGDEELTEESRHGDDFLADVAEQWEAACEPAREAGIRVANVRFGLVLDPNGGALQKMLLPAKCFGGALGDGKQWWSWVALDDAVGAIYHVLQTDGVTGPVNLTAPGPLTNRQFARALGRVLSRPALVPAPAFALRAALGEMADALLLSSARVRPTVLLESGYRFRFDTAEAALRYCLGKDRLESLE
jgi:uncharacterized protein (TIGR01777 family)